TSLLLSDRPPVPYTTLFRSGGGQRYQSGQPLSFGCAPTAIPGFSSYLGPCIRYDLVPGQPLLSSNASSFNVGNAAQANNTGMARSEEHRLNSSHQIISYAVF